MIDQAFVDALEANVLTEYRAASQSYSVKFNNGIVDKKHARDVRRLYSLYKMLFTYDVTATYFDEELIRKIDREYRIHCGYVKNANSTQQAKTGGSGSTTVDLNLAKETYYIYNVGAEVTGDEQSTGITMPETPDVMFNVYIDGFPMRIGNGVKTKDVYFSDDGGTTAKAIQSVITGDTMYFNQSQVGTSLTTDAEIQFEIL